MSIPPVRTPGHTPIGRIIGLVLGLAAVLAVIVLAFSWPGVTSEPKNLPVAISGEAAQVQQLTTALEENAEGLLNLVEVDDAGEAKALIENRTVYGAIVLSMPPEVLASSAASPVVAQLLTGLAGRLEAMANQAAAAQGIVPPQPITVTVTDVVPLSETDPRGSGLAAVSFPLLFGGIIGGIAISLTVVGAWRRVGALLGYVVVGGLAIGGILQVWLDVLQGDYLVNAGAIALSLLAIAAPMVGLSALFGRPGLAIGVVLFVLVANPIASAALPPQFLPEPWGAIGAWFPPGAAAILMRDLSYFPAASIGFPVTVLACWAVAGVVLAVVGPFRTAVGGHGDAPDRAEPSHQEKPVTV